MSPQGAWVTEIHSTLVANEWTLHRVGPHVCMKVSGVIKLFVTEVAGMTSFSVLRVSAVPMFSIFLPCHASLSATRDGAGVVNFGWIIWVGVCAL